ncbi:uncharacterized protein LOC106640879 isoform X2 [Copidosoma floridanum]|uniref:uncharacterized protein LOC106640879 isoform X2 n=1 Tax=Copidosoma floridanum TaxID=29053 RepID=UPI000C6F8B98|nr:uncharacterized protein LOC106640879 isoform X2 [Copidosoma floridanum]
METNTELLVKDPALGDKNSAHKDSAVPNGINNGYDDNEDDISFASDKHRNSRLRNRGVSENSVDNKEEAMEVDSAEPETSSHEENGDGPVSLSSDKTSDAVVLDDESEDLVKKQNARGKNSSVSESMDVDVRSSTSDVECLGDEDAEDEVHDVDEEDVVNDEENDDDDDDDDDVVEDEKDRAIELVDSSLENSDLKICEENGSLGSPDIEEITDGGKSNGHDDEHASNETTPKKTAKKPVDLSNVTPRRSSRNANRKTYLERDLEDDNSMTIDNSSDIEEIKLEDPLAEVDSKDKENSKLKSSLSSPSLASSSLKNLSSNKNTIVVNDTKRLVEIAAGSKNMKGGKKEPTLVIIDTNSILSGKGGVPVSNSSKSHHHHHHHHQQHQHQSSSSNLHGMSSSSSSSFSMMPIGVGPQQMYGNTRTTIMPVPMKAPHISNKSTTITPVMNPLHQQSLQQHHHHQQQQQQQPLPQILPTLTDDMFVVEAPSFIVPYVYEKPPLKPMKEFVDRLDHSIKEFEKEEKIQKQKEKEKNKAEGKDDEDDSDDEEKIEDRFVEKEKSEEEKNKSSSYFDLPLGKFFISIGVGLVQEYVQTDLLRTQKRKHSKGGTTAETQMAINSLIKNLEFSKENNEPFRFELKKCEFCNFKTESALVMQHHLETPHMRNYVYKCNFCTVEVRSPHDILFHMEAEHNTRGRLERSPAFHQCPNCPFEDNQKGKLTRHILACQKKFRPERNLEPSMDWEPPAKIPRLNRPRNMGPQPSPSALAMAMNVKGQQSVLPKLLPAPVTGRGRGRPPVHPRYPDLKNLRPTGVPPNMRQDNMSSMMYRPTSSGLMVPNPNQYYSNNQIFQNTSVTTSAGKNPTAKLMSQPSISITPLPRTAPQPSAPGSGSPARTGGKSTFVICEICDGYIKDLEQLRNHMQWIHKVKIHPKMIYNRPPLNCQKCQFRFFTDQGLERHLLGSHGLVTSSMQEAANRGKDAGRCPACGRVYQWKLLNHVARDHNMTLKPAHLSYKCTVCTATFGMYKQFENHVYSAHSVVAKRVVDKKSSAPSPPSSRSSDSLLKPLKINDEITIIPQPAKSTSRSVPQGRGK